MLNPVYYLELREKKRRIVLLKNEREIAALHFPKWHSSNAVTDKGSLALEIKQQSIWASKFELIANGKRRGMIAANWKQHFNIQLEAVRFGREQNFLIKPKGFLKPFFEVSDPANAETLFILRPVGKWYCRNCRLAIEGPVRLEEALLEEILLYCGFAVRQHEMHTAAAAAV